MRLISKESPLSKAFSLAIVSISETSAERRKKLSGVNTGVDGCQDLGCNRLPGRARRGCPLVECRPGGHDRAGWSQWALEIVGERWAVLIVRELLVGRRRYGLCGWAAADPGQPLGRATKELQAAGVVRPMARLRVIIYELTSDGRELGPVVLAPGAWGSFGGQGPAPVRWAAESGVQARMAGMPERLVIPAGAGGCGRGTLRVACRIAGAHRIAADGRSIWWAVPSWRCDRLGGTRPRPCGQGVRTQICWRHPEAVHEAAGLRAWAGAGPVRRVPGGGRGRCCSWSRAGWGRRCGSSQGTILSRGALAGASGSGLHPAIAFGPLSDMCDYWASRYEHRRRPNEVVLRDRRRRSTACSANSQTRRRCDAPAYRSPRRQRFGGQRKAGSRLIPSRTSEIPPTT